MAQSENNHSYNNHRYPYPFMQQHVQNHTMEGTSIFLPSRNLQNSQLSYDGESTAPRVVQGHAFDVESLNLMSNPSAFHGINHVYETALHDMRIVGTANEATAQFQNPTVVGTSVPSRSRNVLDSELSMNGDEISAFGVQSLTSQMGALNLSNSYAIHDYMHEAVLNLIRINNGAASYASTAHYLPIGTLLGSHPHHNLNPRSGRLVSLAKDPHGSRFLQKKIDEATPQEIHLILKDLVYHLHELIKDPFGHYVVEKFFQSRNTSLEQLYSLIIFIVFHLQKLKVVCMDHLGNQVIQRILENVQDPKMIDTITAAIRCIAVELMKNFNGSYVLQQCLKLFPHVNKDAILDVAAKNCLDIARDRCGCCVIQNCLQYEGLPAFGELVKNIILNAVVLAEDPYGNYVVQFLIKRKIMAVNTSLISRLRNRYVRLSMNKYGSNVVEHLLKYSKMDRAAIIAWELMGSPEFLNVVQHPYGNYAVQRALQYTEGSLHERLSGIIFSNEQKLKSCFYGKMVLQFAKSCRVRGSQNGF